MKVVPLEQKFDKIRCTEALDNLDWIVICELLIVNTKQLTVHYSDRIMNCKLYIV